MRCWIERLFTRHKFMRRSVLFFIMYLIGYMVFNPVGISDDKFIAVCGLFTVAVGLYQWDKYLDKTGKALNNVIPKDN